MQDHKGQPILTGVSVQFPAGKLNAIMGPSGVATIFQLCIADYYVVITNTA